ncbi:MAG: hypothetical protein ACI379_10380 [Nocardioides sp.]|uniref:hypothetical protein n=1 Tax=Nocardioides sp. TaxID=35761 RepID=UPI003F008A7A
MLAAEPVDVDTVVAALREDHVVVDLAAGAGESQKYHDRLVELVRELPFDVYVAMVERPEELAHFDSGEAGEALTTLLQRRLGGDAVYVVATGDHFSPRVSTRGLGVDEDEVYLALAGAVDTVQARTEDLAGEHVYLPEPVEAEAQVRALDDAVRQLRSGREWDELDPLLTEEEVDTLAAEATVLASAAWWRPSRGDRGEYRPASKGAAVAIGGVLALVVGLLLGQSLAGWPRGRSAPAGTSARRTRRGTYTPLRPVVARGRAERAVRHLRRALERDATKPVLDHDLDARALLALSLADRLLEDEHADADLVGAEILAHVGLRGHQMALSGRGKVYRPCFFDPRHGEATASRAWRYGSGDVDVPVCKACLGHLDRGAGPEHLVLPGAREDEPYWKGSDVWARTGYGALSADLVTEVSEALRSRS